MVEIIIISAIGALGMAVRGIALACKESRKHRYRHLTAQALIEKAPAEQLGEIAKSIFQDPRPKGEDEPREDPRSSPD